MIYLDYAATTPVDKNVAEVMSQCLGSPELFGNTASIHTIGRKTNEAVESARARVAELINASARELIWTSGATESDNLAIIGAARFRRSRGKHLVTSVTEHKAVVDSFRALEKEGFDVTWLHPDEFGIISPGNLEAAITDETTLVSIMHVNNETGVVQDIAAIGEVCRRKDVLFHVDAAQSFGRLPLDVRRDQIDMLSLSAHKTYGPKGAGVLFLDSERIRRVEPLLHGGGHERGLRPGTLATHQILGMSRALEIAHQNLAEEPQHILSLRDYLWQLIGVIPSIQLNGHAAQRACHILNVSIADIEGESLLYGMRDFALSSGSACISDSAEPSYVLKSLGRSDQLAQGSIRFSLGRYTTRAELDQAADAFIATVTRLRDLSPNQQLAESG